MWIRHTVYSLSKTPLLLLILTIDPYLDYNRRKWRSFVCGALHDKSVSWLQTNARRNRCRCAHLRRPPTRLHARNPAARYCFAITPLMHSVFNDLFSRFVLVFSNTERYIDDVVRGFVSTSSEPSIVRETPATALVDGTHVPFAFAIMLMDEPKSDNLLCNSELLRSELYKTELDLECMHRKQRRGSRGGKFCNATRHPESLKNKIIPIYLFHKLMHRDPIIKVRIHKTNSLSQLGAQRRHRMGGCSRYSTYSLPLCYVSYISNYT